MHTHAEGFEALWGAVYEDSGRNMDKVCGLGAGLRLQPGGRAGHGCLHCTLSD